MATGGEHEERVLPLFIVDNQLPAFDKKPFTTAEICAALERKGGYNSMEGAQKIGGLWRLYARDNRVRQKLLIEGFVLRGVTITVKEKNPFLVSSVGGESREVPATKLIISNVPLSVSDDEIKGAVMELPGVVMRSRIIAEKDRDEQGKLTHWKTGRSVFVTDTRRVTECPLFAQNAQDTVQNAQDTVQNAQDTVQNAQDTAQNVTNTDNNEDKSDKHNSDEGIDRSRSRIREKLKAYRRKSSGSVKRVRSPQGLTSPYRTGKQARVQEDAEMSDSQSESGENDTGQHDSLC
ncbi:hypothetical protein BaRGS_00040451 [Batillaria attramentaria]|uniref:Uncharacterized protein n=1 Tax=Batillaria attramentaria TaxID=370345 RepID=A0ABD0J016_9CAEN